METIISKCSIETVERLINQNADIDLRPDGSVVVYDPPRPKEPESILIYKEAEDRKCPRCGQSLEQTPREKTPEFRIATEYLDGILDGKELK